ncbi:hypothetical protein BDV12DRAFT_172265 [Aspergillus spectabilis]
MGVPVLDSCNLHWWLVWSALTMLIYGLFLVGLGVLSWLAHVNEAWEPRTSGNFTSKLSFRVQITYISNVSQDSISAVAYMVQACSVRASPRRLAASLILQRQFFTKWRNSIVEFAALESGADYAVLCTLS